MKNIIIAIVSFLAIGGITNSASAQQADRDQYTIQVDGLGCPFCAFGLEKKFKEFKGIKNVKIDMETGVFNFSYPASTPLSIEEVQAQVDKAGYTPMSTEIKRTDGKVETAKMELPVFEVNEAEVVTASLVAAGKCGMCEKRIERTAMFLAGVISAEWKKRTQTVELKFDKSLVSLEEIEKAIAGAGHDTKGIKATDEKYKSLPACCHYKRNVN